MKFLNTPFSYFGLLFIGLGIAAIHDDLANPTKMTPVGVYMGVIMISSILITKAIAYLVYRVWNKSHYTFMGIEILLFIIVLPLLVLLAFKI